MSRAEVTRVSGPLLAACAAQTQQGGEFQRECRTVLELAEAYPGDPGVLVSLLMNRVVLQPGEALFLPAGNLHAYLSGTGVEIMANSDNVLRGGLTTKHVDIPELNSVLDFHPVALDVLDGTPLADGQRQYPVPTAQFSLRTLDLVAGPFELWHHGPQVLLVAQGTMVARDGTDGTGGTVTVPSGGSLWVPPGGFVTVSGHGQVFRATDGLLPSGHADRPGALPDLELRAS
jgi:mannose-6-phosphate isomerase